MLPSKTVRVLFGPTASGKTAQAIAQALAFGSNNTAIINADAMQCYAGLPILSAQPTLAEQQGVPHYLFSHLPLTTNQTAGQWAESCTTLIQTLHAEGKVVFVVGGTGFYLKALMEGLSPIPSADPAVLQVLETQQNADLYAQLKQADPALATKLKENDRQRVVRALSVYQTSGKPLSYWQNIPPIPAPFTFHVQAPTITDLPWLETRIAQRVQAMVAAGALAEVAQVKAQNPPATALGLKTHGYSYLNQHLDGALPLAEAIALTTTQTRQYAKRQRTWLRTQIKVDEWLAPIKVTA